MWLSGLDLLIFSSVAHNKSVGSGFESLHAIVLSFSFFTIMLMKSFSSRYDLLNLSKISNVIKPFSISVHLFHSFCEVAWPSGLELDLFLLWHIFWFWVQISACKNTFTFILNNSVCNIFFLWPMHHIWQNHQFLLLIFTCLHQPFIKLSSLNKL